MNWPYCPMTDTFVAAWPGGNDVGQIPLGTAVVDHSPEILGYPRVFACNQPRRLTQPPNLSGNGNGQTVLQPGR